MRESESERAQPTPEALPSASEAAALKLFRRSEACLEAQSAVLVDKPDGGRLARVDKTTKKERIEQNNQKQQQQQQIGKKLMSIPL